MIESLAAAMAVTGLALLVLRADAPTQRRAATLGGIAIGGLALNLALIAAGDDDLITRNVIALWVPAARRGASSMPGVQLQVHPLMVARMAPGPTRNPGSDTSAGRSTGDRLQAAPHQHSGTRGAGPHRSRRAR